MKNKTKKNRCFLSKSEGVWYVLNRQLYFASPVIVLSGRFIFQLEYELTLEVSTHIQSRLLWFDFSRAAKA